jgi:hypothetical protein
VTDCFCKTGLGCAVATEARRNLFRETEKRDNTPKLSYLHYTVQSECRSKIHTRSGCP